MVKYSVVKSVHGENEFMQKNIFIKEIHDAVAFSDFSKIAQAFLLFKSKSFEFLKRLELQQKFIPSEKTKTDSKETKMLNNRYSKPNSLNSVSFDRKNRTFFSLENPKPELFCLRLSWWNFYSLKFNQRWFYSEWNT